MPKCAHAHIVDGIIEAVLVQDSGSCSGSIWFTIRSAQLHSSSSSLSPYAAKPQHMDFIAPSGMSRAWTFARAGPLDSQMSASLVAESSLCPATPRAHTASETEACERSSLSIHSWLPPRRRSSSSANLEMWLTPSFQSSLSTPMQKSTVHNSAGFIVSAVDGIHLSRRSTNWRACSGNCSLIVAIPFMEFATAAPLGPSCILMAKALNTGCASNM
mmetsp:Transcript_30740/g.71832  ORF Transcript_30740/g.71832 Transcript_30740/m.71832 type:complete len:216 (-) Transcript_30740:213-860(-)